MTSNTGLPEGFETLQDATTRDSKGADALMRSKVPGARELAARIRPSWRHNDPHETLTSSRYRRDARIQFYEAVNDVFKPYPDADLRLVTVVSHEWFVPEGELHRFPLQSRKDTFKTQLHRAGVTSMPGPLVGAIHGDYDTTTGGYQVHLHILTTREKAEAIKRTLRSHPSFRSTKHIARPIHELDVDDRGRAGLITYLLKPYWSMRNSYWSDKQQKWVRSRSEQTLRPQQLAEVLLWLDTLRLGDLIYTSGTELPRSLRNLGQQTNEEF